MLNTEMLSRTNFKNKLLYDEDTGIVYIRDDLHGWLCPYYSEHGKLYRYDSATKCIIELD